MADVTVTLTHLERGNFNWETVSIRAAFGGGFGVLSSLLIYVAGPGPLWWSRATYESYLSRRKLGGGGGGRRQSRQERELPSKQLSSMGSCPDSLQWWTWNETSKPNKAFPPPVTFGQCHNNRKAN